MAAKSQRVWLGIAWAAVAAAVLVRAGAATGDLWLDELWSLQLLVPAQSPLDVFAKIHHDNNHYLNSLWLYSLGGSAEPFTYRALSVLASFGMMAVAVTAPWARAPIAIAATAVLLAGSRFLVQYGSEARGYALATFFALACFVSLDRWRATRESRWLALFALGACLGLLSHLTFVFVLAAGLTWAAFELARRRQATVLEVALLALPPALIALLWYVDVRHSQVGGAPTSEISSTVRELVRTTFGPPRGALELVSLGFLALGGYELWALARERDSRVVFFIALYLAPVIVFLVWRFDYTTPRHFAVLVPLTLVLVGAGLGRLARVSRAGVLVAALAVAVFLAGNAVQIAALLRDGRGRYGEALAYMLARAPSHSFTIGGFNDFRNPLVLDDQARRLGAADRVTYFDLTKSPASVTPDWVLVIDGHEQPEGPATFERTGRTYSLARVFPYAGLSGWSWLLYRRE